MKKQIVFLLLFFAMGQVSSQDLTVHLNDIKSPNEGRLVFLLYASEEGFPKEHDKAIRKGVVNEFSNSASYIFPDIPAGKYAVVVMQDKNENKKMDTNFMGMPNEPVGVSNQSGIGRPSFERSAFEMNGKEKTIELRFMNDQ